MLVLLAALLAALPVPVGCRRKPEKTAAPTPAPAPVAATDAELLHLRNLAVAALEAGKHLEAAQRLQKLSELIPEEPMPWANRGLIALREGQVDEARPLLETAARLAPDDPDIAVLRGQAAQFEGEDQRARAVLQHAVDANPSHRRARWELAELLRRDPSPAGARAYREHLAALIRLAPENLVTRLALARARLEDQDRAGAADELRAIEALGVIDGGQVRELFERARAAIDAGETRTARSSVIALDNVLKPTPAWQDSLAALRGPPVPVADPLWNFLSRTIPEPSTAPQAIEVSYRDAGAELGPDLAAGERAVVLEDDLDHRPSLAVAAGGGLRILRPGTARGYENAAEIPPAAARGEVTALLALDWNNDRHLDLVAGDAKGTIVFFTPGEDGTWRRVPDVAPPRGERPGAAVRVLLPWDADHDGDLDLLVGRDHEPASLLRNNGDGSFVEAAEDMGLTAAAGDQALIGAGVADLDEDGDLDLVAVTADRRLIRLDNRRSGRFAAVPIDAGEAPVDALALADLNNDGWIDLALAGADGTGRVALSRRGRGFQVRGAGAATAGGGTATFVRAFDYDNDGWMDLLFVAGGAPLLQRNIGGGRFEPPASALPPPAGPLADIQPTDRDGDGDLDLLVVPASGPPTMWDNQGGNAHGWQQVRLEAVLKGGQRNNAFGVGGLIELRAGSAYEKRLVRGPVTHFGLGNFGPADTLRVLWPNGVPQNVLSPEPNQRLTEKQLLKGSCPFLLAFDGERLAFVTDLLWRSPLGMKINAQTVAPVGSTRDRVKIEAGQLRPRRGRYEIAITAALWETIYVDQVKLWAVDHPASVEIFVDERFRAPRPPPFRIELTHPLRPPRRAVDHYGRDVLAIVSARDGRRLGGFAKGRYQGMAEDHFVEVDLGAWAEPQTVRLVASGWTRPTDTSINVAVGQRRGPRPVPLAVEVADGTGGWVTAIANAGFPAGKLKTIVLDLSGAFPTADHRLRLRTNMEIYWDRIAVAVGTPAFTAAPVSLVQTEAVLKPVGFPRMRRGDDVSPSIPDYTAPSYVARWRDLEGWYTRYGDVAPLLAETDDRFVIMNAGDGIALSFRTGPPPPPGWVRDFVLMTDGWVKDGDLNTVASQTVGPLPRHDRPVYGEEIGERSGSGRAADPDARAYHTRYVTPVPFRDRMRGGRR